MSEEFTIYDWLKEHPEEKIYICKRDGSESCFGKGECCEIGGLCQLVFEEKYGLAEVVSAFDISANLTYGDIWRQFLGDYHDSDLVEKKMVSCFTIGEEPLSIDIHLYDGRVYTYQMMKAGWLKRKGETNDAG